MPASWLFGNQDPAIFTSSIDSGGDFELGVACEPSVDCALSGMRFYRVATGVGNAPTTMRIWDRATASIIAEPDALVDNGEVGWQETLLDSPVSVTAHQQLWVTGVFLAGSERPLFLPTAGYPTPYRLSLPDPPALLGVPLSVYHYVNGEGVPNVQDQSFLTGVDAQFTSAPASGGGTLLATTTFSNAIKWVQEADYYLLNVTTSPQGRYERDADGVIISRLIGSWSPISGDYAGQRYQIDYRQMKLVLPAGQHMEGVSIALLMGAEATIEAYGL